MSTQWTHDTAAPPGVGASSAVTLRTGNRTYLFDQSQAPIMVGRDQDAQVHLIDEHVSGTHLVLEHSAQGWAARDNSLNGTFVRGTRQSLIPIRGATTVHLGHPRGVALSIVEDAAPVAHQPAPAPDDDDDVTVLTDVTDPGVARAGAAVAARRRELELAQRYLAANGVISAGALIDLEKGRRWPRSTTRSKLEEALGWPQGHIVALRNQDIEPDEQTVTLTGSERVPMMAEVLVVALQNVATTIDGLPEVSDPDFSTRAARVLTDLRTLEASAAGAARAATGDSVMAKTLGAVRKNYRDVMLRAARSPDATLGQQLFAARHRSELSVEEFANAAGVPVDALKAAEAEATLPQGTIAALRAALTNL